MSFFIPFSRLRQRDGPRDQGRTSGGDAARHQQCQHRTQIRTRKYPPPPATPIPTQQTIGMYRLIDDAAGQCVTFSDPVFPPWQCVLPTADKHVFMRECSFNQQGLWFSISTKYYARCGQFSAAIDPQ